MGQWICAGAMLFGSIGLLWAQPQGKGAPDIPERLSPEEGAIVLEAFRNARLAGDFCFLFELVHKPRRGSDVVFEGRMWGTWNDAGPLTRVQLLPEGVENTQAGLDLLVQNGGLPMIWKWRGEQLPRLSPTRPSPPEASSSSAEKPWSDAAILPAPPDGASEPQDDDSPSSADTPTSGESPATVTAPLGDAEPAATTGSPVTTTAPEESAELTAAKKEAVRILENRRMTTQERFEPLIEGVVYTPFDLQMPFIFWSDFSYEWKGHAKGRLAHRFLLHPPAELKASNPDVGPVRVYIDSKFNALLKAEVLDVSGDVIKTFKILSFTKVQDQYIVKTIDLVDERTRDKTRFTVKAAALDLLLPEVAFLPSALGSVTPGIPSDRFEFL